MDVLLSQLPALLGVIVGAVGSYMATYLVERVRWNRQQTTRWDEERRKAYAEYAHSVKAVIQMSAEIAAARGVNTRFRIVNKVDVEESLKELARVAFERSAKWESVLLLGDDKTIEAGRAWHSLALRMEEFAHGSRNDPEEWASVYADAGAARDYFYEQARRDLRIHVGTNVSPRGLWRRRPASAAGEMLQAPASEHKGLSAG
ncbi:hypothetical protein [Nonomuraea sp. NPDC049625]|uniref:hypothetical protein n=1 Tax=Nonomuraea sp. NPDC049625 TaxID=3155775 RepID=UPI00343F6128